MERRSSLLYGVLVFILGLALVQPLASQETVGAVNGVVTDDSGAALPGVAVAITAKATGSEQRTDTDGQGRYRFVALNVGSYTLSAQLEGFQTVESDVDVSVGATRTVNLRMPLGAVEDTIVVTSDVPLIDATSTVGGVTVRTDKFAERVPIVRDAAQVAMVAPGTTTGDAAFDSASRAYTPGQRVTSIGGSSVAENTYLINGLNITNFRNGVGGSAVPFEFVQEVQVKTGGYEAEFGRSTGGVLNMVTKSGSNKFTGGVNVYYHPEGLQETSPDSTDNDNSVEDFESTEANFYIGGPIWQDKIFFFAMYQYNDVNTEGAGGGRDTLRVRDDPYYGGKIDINLTASHRLEGTYFSDEVTVASGEFELDTSTGNPGAAVGAGTYDAGGSNLIAKYTGIFGSNFVVSAQYGENDFERSPASTADGSPLCIDQRSGSSVSCGNWVNTFRGNASDERQASRVDLDFFVGDHSLRGGFDDETNTSNDLTEYSGGDYYRFYNNGAGDDRRFDNAPENAELTRYRIFQGGGTFETLSNAIYLQDSWEVTDKLLLNLGVRVEEFDNKNALGESFIKKKDQYAPRIGAIYDMGGDGRSKLYANYGRYHLYIASNTNIRLAGAELFTEDWYLLPSGCDINNPTTSSCLGDFVAGFVFGDGEVPDVRATKAGTVDPMYQDEWVLGYERLIGDNWSVGVRGVYRDFGEVIEDITIDAALGPAGFGAFEYRLVNPGTDIDVFADADGDGVLEPYHFTAAELGYPAPIRKYYATEITFNRRFADNWMFQGSYTWSHSYGNYEGYVRSDNGQDDAGITTLYDFAGLLDGAYGNLPNDRRNNLKLFGAYSWDNGFFLGSAFTWRDGRPINAFSPHPTDIFAELYGSESFFDGPTLVPRGSRGRTDDIINIDLTAKYEMDVGSVKLTFRGDVFNLLDADTATEVDEEARLESGDVNPFYLEEISFQRPRRVRFSVGVAF